MDGWMGGWVDGWMDECIGGRMTEAGFRNVFHCGPKHRFYLQLSFICVKTFRLKNPISKSQLIIQGLINNTGLMHLRIVVRDGGTPAMSSYLTVIFRIASAADEHPLFNKSFYHFNVSEDAHVGATVGEVFARTKSTSNIITYDFVSEQSHFKINKNNVS